MATLGGTGSMADPGPPPDDDGAAAGACAEVIAPYRAALEATREMVATADDRLNKRGDGIAAHIYMVNALDAIDALLADPPQGTWRDVASAEFAEELVEACRSAFPEYWERADVKARAIQRKLVEGS